MSLPKIDYPIYNLNIPSLNIKNKFRPFLVKEEKLLLMAKENNDSAEYLSAIKQVVNNCAVDNNFNIDKLTTFDLEYLFLKLRSVSVDNIVKLTYIDNEDKQTYNFEINLDNIEVKFPDKIDNNIKITDSVGLLMRYPSASLYSDEDFLNLDRNYMFELIIRCLDKIYDNDQIYEFKNYSKKEIEEFLDNLNIKAFEQINNFLTNVPKLYYLIEYTNSLGNERKIELSSLSDFFM